MVRTDNTFLVFSNCPFRAVEHPEFVTLVELLRPGVKLAGRKELSKHFVPELFDNEVKAVKNLVQGLPSLYVFGSLWVFGYLGLFNDLFCTNRFSLYFRKNATILGWVD